METLLHYVWKHRLYASGNFKTIEGISLEIIDPGIYNSDSGPDFFNAKVKLGEKLWAGNIEIHSNSSDWYKHKHELDEAYNSVILHVVEFIDQLDIHDTQGRLIPQWLISVPSQVQKNYQFLLQSDYLVPCLGRLWEIPEIHLASWKDVLLIERLERKTKEIENLLDKYQSDWNEVFYIVLARNFGFGINNDSFQRLAESLPLKYIYKHADSIIHTEALFLGQAGLLKEELDSDEYYLSLQKEYEFLSQKYDLGNLKAYIFKSLRIRPQAFPHIKIVQLAGLIRKQPHLLSRILDAKSLHELQKLFFMDINEYWNTHYQFGKISCFRPKKPGLNTVNLLIINTVVPILLAYGRLKNKEEYSDMAFQLLERMQPESNYITNSFRRYGISVEHAGDSQALIQLKREYCDKKKCIYCRIGHQLLRR